MVTEARPERRRQMPTLIDKLVHDRQQMWTFYCKVADLKPFTSGQQTETLLNEFCQLLIDYISLGHFGIYQRIVDGKERRNAVLRAAESVYPDIADTTEAAVSFNEKYAALHDPELSKNLETDLSQLGENLAKRIDAEDQLCNVILQ